MTGNAVNNPSINLAITPSGKPLGSIWESDWTWLGCRGVVSRRQLTGGAVDVISAVGVSIISDEGFNSPPTLLAPFPVIVSYPRGDWVMREVFGFGQAMASTAVSATGAVDQHFASKTHRNARGGEDILLLRIEQTTTPAATWNYSVEITFFISTGRK